MLEDDLCRRARPGASGKQYLHIKEGLLDFLPPAGRWRVDGPLGAEGGCLAGTVVTGVKFIGRYKIPATEEVRLPRLVVRPEVDPRKPIQMSIDIEVQVGVNQTTEVAPTPIGCTLASWLDSAAKDLRQKLVAVHA